jgi:ABC-type protease/lipase transport system fused ATPase/permease subunit
MGALDRLKSRGATVLCVTQRTDLLMRADLILRLHQGRVDMFGSRDDVLGRAARAANLAKEQSAGARQSVPITLAGRGST